MEKQDYVIKDLTLKKRDFLGFVFATLVIGLGLGLIIEYVCRKTDSDHSWVLLLVGSAVTIIGIGFVVALSFGKAKKEIEIKGAFVFNKKTLRIQPISQYECSRGFVESIDALFTEKPGIKDLWEKGYAAFAKEGMVKKPSEDAKEFLTLVEELVEYEALDKASITFQDFFDQIGSSKKIRKYTKDDFSNIFLSNRFLSCFSEDPKNRQNFKPHLSMIRIDEDGKEEDVFDVAQDGRIYNKFELSLPKHSKIKCLKNKGIVLDTPQFSLELQPSFAGFGASINDDFCQLYLGEKLNPSFHPYSFYLSVKIKYKFIAFFSPNQRLYSWIDIYLEELEKYFSFDGFLQTIDWPSRLAMAWIVRNMFSHQKDPLESDSSTPSSPEADSNKKESTIEPSGENQGSKSGHHR